MLWDTPQKILLNLLTAVVLACFLAGGAFADEDRVAQLEARVAELENLVQQLLQNPARSGVEETAQKNGIEKAASPELAVAVTEQKKKAEKTKTPANNFKFGGYIKADALFSDFNGGSVASGSNGRDFYIPATIPVGTEGESYLDFHAKESRIHFRSDHELESGGKLLTYLEIDFQLSEHGDERISNSYTPRLRHAFVNYNNWTFGQTWTTLYNVSACPDNLDFIGPAESTIFGRQAMIRYTNGPWQFALENPETTITPYGGGDRIVTDDNLVPDVVLRYNHSSDWGSFTAAGIVRQLAYEHSAADINDSTSSYGISLSGKIYIGEADDFRWMISTGKGLGRYIGLNTANGAVLDANNRLEAIGSSGLYGSYRHLWNRQWRSNLTLGYLSVDNDVALTGMDVTRKATSLHFNLIFSPQSKLDFGVEYLFANRELENGDDGDLRRLQFSAKYMY